MFWYILVIFGNITKRFGSITNAGGCWRQPLAASGSVWLLLAASGCLWLLLAGPASPNITKKYQKVWYFLVIFWYLLVIFGNITKGFGSITNAGGCWRLLLAASGSVWLLLAASGCFWLALPHQILPKNTKKLRIFW